MEAIDYKTKISRPNIRDFTIHYVYDKGVVIAALEKDAADKIKELRNVYPNLVVQKCENRDEYNKACDIYSEDINFLAKLLMQDLFREYNLEVNEFTIALYNKCVEQNDNNIDYIIYNFNNYAHLDELAKKVYRKTV